MAEAYIVDAVRTPVGKRNGGLAGVHPADMGAHVIRAVVERTGIDPAAIDDVVIGCLDNIGAQAGDIARTAALAAGLPESVPGVTIDRQCGSSQQSVHFAAQAVMSGTMDVVIAGGIQNMSQYPILCAFKAGEPYGANNPWTGSQGWEARYGSGLLSQFAGAEAIAEQWGISREEMEAFALRSHERALQAIKNGHFDREVLPIAGVHHDEGPRPDSSLEKLAGLNALKPGGRLTAGLSSQISDGSAALLVANERAVKAHNLKPRARIHHLTVLGADPKIMLSAPIPATQRALERAGMSINDIDVYECNEAFASVPMAWAKELGADQDKLNPNGGAIAIGHPIGASGARIVTTLLHELERTGGRYGLQTMCEGGGQANVTIIERL
ncbi:MAG TPA: acetyl-CoA C-acetyltransferase [Sporichthyaceae bacterium]